MRHPFRIAVGLMLLNGCHPDYSAERSECAEGVVESDHDGATALDDATPADLASIWDAATFVIDWAAAPLPSDWLVSLTPASATGVSLTWQDRPGCPVSPTVTVTTPAVMSTEDLTASGTMTQRWFDLGPPEGSSNGEPVFNGTITPTVPVESWLRDVLRSSNPEVDDGDLVAIGLGISTSEHAASIDATFRIDGTDVNFPLEGQQDDFAGTVVPAE